MLPHRPKLRQVGRERNRRLTRSPPRGAQPHSSLPPITGHVPGRCTQAKPEPALDHAEARTAVVHHYQGPVVLITFSAAEKRIRNAQAIIDTTWRNYKRINQTPEEKLLVKLTELVKNKADKETQDLLYILSKKDTLGVNRLIQNIKSTRTAPFSLKITDLIDLEVLDAKQILNNNKTLYKITSTNLILFILLSLAIALSLSFLIIKNVRGLIKDLLKSNNEIKESERKYHSLLEQASDAIYVLNLKGNFTDANESMCKITGYSRDELLQLNVADIIDPEQLKTDPIIPGYYRPDRSFIRERRMIRKDGTIFDMEINVKKVSDDRIMVVARDVTERKKTEQALEAAYQEKNTILESIGDAFFAVDQNWVVTYWNNHAEKVLMVAKNEIVGKNLWDVFSGSINSESYKKYHEALEIGEMIHFEDYYEPLNTWYEISAYPSHSGLSVYFKDITERKLIEHTLSAERNLLRTLIDNLPHSVYFKNKYAQKLISNKVDHELLGVKTEGEVLGKTDLDMLPPEIAAVGYEQDIMVLDNGKPLINHEHHYTTANGTWIAMLTSKIPLFDEKNEVIGLVGIGRDITEQKLAEKKLQELNAELEKSIKQLTISNTELEQFAYVASHDLQEPLRMVTSFMMQLEKKYGDVVDDKGRQYIHFAVDGAKRMRQIILDLLDFSRVGSIEDDMEDVDFNKVLSEIQALYRKQIEELHAKIKFENLPTLHVYKTPIRQVFQNLLSNSLKYHGKGVAPVIEISGKETKTHYQFSVKDNGIGIAPEYFDKIFIISQRLHNRDEYSGTGMGLAITKKIVERLGGKIWLESEEGKGSTFHFTLLKKQ